MNCLASDTHLVPHRKPQELINVPAAQESGIQVIKRFSGGGTVVTDENTVFATVILQTSALPADVECSPRPLMRWSESLYAPVFSPYGRFNLQENGANPESSTSLSMRTLKHIIAGMFVL